VGMNSSRELHDLPGYGPVMGHWNPLPGSPYDLRSIVEERHLHIRRGPDPVAPDARTHEPRRVRAMGRLMVEEARDRRIPAAHAASISTRS